MVGLLLLEKTEVRSRLIMASNLDKGKNKKARKVPVRKKGPRPSAEEMLKRWQEKKAKKANKI